MITIACALGIHEQCVDNFITDRRTKHICECDCHRRQKPRPTKRGDSPPDEVRRDDAWKISE